VILIDKSITCSENPVQDPVELTDKLNAVNTICEAMLSLVKNPELA
jgi:hypothetical protein